MVVLALICLGIYIIGAVNNQEIHYNQKEHLKNTLLTRISILIIYGIILSVLQYIKVEL